MMMMWRCRLIHKESLTLLFLFIVGLLAVGYCSLIFFMYFYVRVFWKNPPGIEFPLPIYKIKTFLALLISFPCQNLS